MVLNNISQDAKILIDSLWEELRKKYWKSLKRFILLNIFLFVINALITVLSLFAVRFNDHDTKSYFVALAILTNVTSGLSTFVTFFEFKKTYALCAKKLDAIKKERSFYDGRMYEYSKPNRTIFYLKKIENIINAENI